MRHTIKTLLSPTLMCCVALACGPSVEGDEPGEDVVAFRKAVAGVYSSTLSPIQPAPAPTSRRSIYTLSEDGTGEAYTYYCDGEITAPTQLEWARAEGFDGRVEITSLFEDGTTSSFFWDIPDPCSPSSDWRQFDERGNEGRRYEPGRYCNPALSDYNPASGLHVCEFEFCGDLPEICAGDPE